MPKIAALTKTNTVQHRMLYTSPIIRAANPQSGKPASDNLGHMVKNVKEEAKGVGASIGSAVAGTSSTSSSDPANDSQAKEAGQTNELVSDAKTIVGEMVQRVPRPALLWGAAGIVPYVSTAGASVYLARQAQLVAQGLDSHIDFETASALLLHAENVQITFGAVLLSFLGAIHWGFEFAKFGGAVGNRRYFLGLVPVMVAWPTLMLTPQLALVGQWAGFVLTWFIDLRATSQGWAPKWYSSYRFGLSLAVGVSIIATLAGTNYYDADNSRSSARGIGRRLSKVKAEASENTEDMVKRIAAGDQGTPVHQEKVGGDVQAEHTGAQGDSFVKIRNPKREEEERKKKEEEEKKKKEEEEKKKKEEKEGGEEKKEEKEGGEEKKDDKE
ncbi:uncharacterized protein FA14DRAFT_164948 [Meira miltonrushii]|uniref:Uncharacterized protein n=1 Tax=Meira miltonrushii TaxID=1280837 RepID=A0A316V7G3_9BASI|nr:uncharacterized protein FA14DRAFT_164948 [Meira miltonrushii]PWN33537.1 hypothetical protein FA14DRAFT_164948 [Meira miltonrushii]